MKSMNCYMLVGPGKEALAAISLRHLRIHFPPLSVSVVASRETWTKVKGLVGSLQVAHLDEDLPIAGLTFSAVRNATANIPRSHSGWLYQQFAKMQLALLQDDLDKHYIVVDADTIFLRPIDFFAECKPVFSIKQEYHEPYFLLLRELLGCEKQIQGSFISEFMVFKPEFVIEFMKAVSSISDWFLQILRAIQEDSRLSFSEFESYGTFVSERHPGDYLQRQFNIMRFESEIVGTNPSEMILKTLARRFDVVTFERHRRLNAKQRFLNRVHLVLASVWNRDPDIDRLYGVTKDGR